MFYKVKRIATDECVIKKTGEQLVISSKRNVIHFGQVPNFSRTITGFKGGERVNIRSSIIIHG